MKLFDFDVYIKKDGSFVIGTENKRGNLKANYKDVTRTVTDFFVKTFETSKGHFKQYKIGDDHYSIKVEKLTNEEVETIKKNKAEKGKRSFEKFGEYMNFIYQNQNDTFFEPVKLKKCHQIKK